MRRLTVTLMVATTVPWANAQPTGGDVTLSRQSAMELLQQLEALQTEVRQLRNTVEVQTNELERLKAAQRDLLVDIDQRLTALERGVPEQMAAPRAPAAPTAPAPGGVTPVPGAPRRWPRGPRAPQRPRRNGASTTRPSAC
jgi:TolA-binding protein